MRKVVITSWALVAIACAAPALSDYTPREIEAGLAECKKSPPVQQVDINGCAGYEAARAELRLTRAYRAIRALLKKVGDPGDAEHLLKVQRAWIAYRELACESRDRGTMAASEYAICMMSMAGARASDLKVELRNECDRSCGTDSRIKECAACDT
jgi:uncharacterized protein YecT (DUF1311 family)